jgi:MFS family permease
MHATTPGLFEESPTRVRYTVMSLLCGLAFVLYIDRICIGQAASVMMKELGISKAHWGWVGVAFQIAYAIFEPTTGHWGDCYGSRRVLIRIVLWWSIFTALTGAVWKFSWEITSGIAITSFALLLLIRFLFGAGEAGALPNAARVISIWFPPGRRGPAQALISACAQIGGMTAPWVTAFFISSPAIGWRLSFVIFGALGLVWIAVFRWLFYDDPKDHPRVNQAELRYIHMGRDESPVKSTQVAFPLVNALFNRNIYLLGLANACSSFYSYMLFSWFPTYLKEGRGLTEGQSGGLGTLPYLCGATGVLLGGYLGDFLTRKLGSRRRALAIMGTGGLLVAGVLVGSSIYVDSPLFAVLLCSVGYFFAYIQLAAWWAAMSDVGGRNLGALFGLCNMVGLSGGAISQVFLGYYVDHNESLNLVGRAAWDPAFQIYALVLICGGVLWLFIDPDKKVEATSGGVKA